MSFEVKLGSRVVSKENKREKLARKLFPLEESRSHG